VRPHVDTRLIAFVKASDIYPVHFRDDPCCDEKKSWPLEVRRNSTVGRYIVASRAVKPLEMVLKDYPAVVATQSKPACLVCLRQTSRNAKCKGR
jgi:hypothetical protein